MLKIANDHQCDEWYQLCMLHTHHHHHECYKSIKSMGNDFIALRLYRYFSCFLHIFFLVRYPFHSFHFTVPHHLHFFSITPIHAAFECLHSEPKATRKKKKEKKIRVNKIRNIKKFIFSLDDGHKLYHGVRAKEHVFKVFCDLTSRRNRRRERWKFHSEIAILE